jgi:hypothetical protein
MLLVQTVNPEVKPGTIRFGEAAFSLVFLHYLPFLPR